MICEKCRRDNTPEANFCSFCGSDLRDSPPRRPWIVPAVILVAILGALLAYLGIHPPTEPTPAPQPSQSPRATAVAPAKKTVPSGSAAVSPEVDFEVDPVVGVVLIRDIVGNVRTRIPSAVSRGGWIALPVARCRIGAEWYLHLATGQRLRIEGGLVNEGEEVGIWRIEPGYAIDGPPLDSWQEALPLNWHSIVSVDSAGDLPFVVVDQQLYLTKIDVPGDVAGPGVFFQGSNLVGWTFDDLPGTGFLWNGAAGEQLGYGVSVSDFYRLNFADGREERFLLALSQPDVAPAGRLLAMADGFLQPKKLPEPETPVLLSDAAAVEQMRILIDRLRRNGDAGVILDSIRGEALAAAGSIPLLVDAVEALAEGDGPQSAIQLLESVEYLDPAFLRTDIQSVDNLSARFYRQWLSQLIDSADLQTGWQVYGAATERHPRDPYLHLMGVQLAIDAGQLAMARQLLAMRSYPEALADRVQALEGQLAPQAPAAAEEPIRFSPGADQVRISAVLNDAVSQTFIVDTGATVVTIPQSTARRLGLDRVGLGTYREVYTAGGTVQAREVELEVFELQGQVLQGVRALVMDLPGRPNVGLLGMNVLSRFRMDLNTETGELLLTPK
ncbi:MAG TPA: TIGR02281 family clan AA aspartic protease [Desulfobacterales bacterium]